MKTLAESLFDNKLVSKDLTIGDVYKLSYIYLEQLWFDELRWLFKFFTIPKFKEDKIKPFDINGSISERFKYIPKTLEPIQYILSIIMDLPFKPELMKQDCNSLVYNKLLKDSLYPYINKRYSWEMDFHLYKDHGQLKFRIYRDTPKESQHLEIDFKEK